LEPENDIQLTAPQLEHQKKLVRILCRYVPLKAAYYCTNKIMEHQLHLHIEEERSDRLGDFSPHKGNGNRISINYNLSPYDFLITFAHELAHFMAYQKYGINHRPHGKEWKQEFKNCLRPMVLERLFPNEITKVLNKHMQNPAYTHSGDLELAKVLAPYERNKYIKLLDNIEEGTKFKTASKSRSTYIKGNIVGIYVLCKNASSGKESLFHRAAKVYVTN
jgi:hypothetical protein